MSYILTLINYALKFQPLNTWNLQSLSSSCISTFRELRHTYRECHFKDFLPLLPQGIIREPFNYSRVARSFKKKEGRGEAENYTQLNFSFKSNKQNSVYVLNVTIDVIIWKNIHFLWHLILPSWSVFYRLEQTGSGLQTEDCFIVGRVFCCIVVD